MIADQKINNQLLILKIIWVAMLVSLVINLCVGLYTATNFPPLLTEDMFALLRTVLYGVSIRGQLLYLNF